MSALELVQATLAARDLSAASAAARSELGLAPGFPDPELASFAMANEVLTLGDTYLEIVAPAGETSALHRFLAGGEGGYLLAIRVPDTAALVERAAAANVRVVHRQDFQGATITQLHPGDLGVMLEADEIPAGREWHYDDWSVPARPPGASAGDLLAADVAVRDPEATADLWARLLDAPAAGDGVPSVRIGSRTVRFVPHAETDSETGSKTRPGTGTGRRGLVALDLRSLTPGAPPREITVAGLTIRLVPAEKSPAEESPAEKSAPDGEGAS
ncbi:VOC family protein [Streptosporangium sp. NPDC002721]|uniref:VOC family protein n=1 Tax=Streptosporangium sp. NPDC002721 TaxID=3366188 RepID=UPI00368EEC2D